MRTTQTYSDFQCCVTEAKWLEGVECGTTHVIYLLLVRPRYTFSHPDAIVNILRDFITFSYPKAKGEKGTPYRLGRLNSTATREEHHRPILIPEASRV